MGQQYLIVQTVQYTNSSVEDAFRNGGTRVSPQPLVCTPPNLRLKQRTSRQMQPTQSTALTPTSASSPSPMSCLSCWPPDSKKTKNCITYYPPLSPFCEPTQLFCSGHLPTVRYVAKRLQTLWQRKARLKAEEQVDNLHRSQGHYQGNIASDCNSIHAITHPIPTICRQDQSR